MIFWSILIIALVAIVLLWLLFQPINLVLPTNDKNHPTKVVHEVEDVREFPMEGNLDVKAHYHAQEEDTIM